MGTSEALPHHRFSRSWWGSASLVPPYTDFPQQIRITPRERSRGAFDVPNPKARIPEPRITHALAEMSHGREADLFLLMTEKDELTTKTGKPYFRVGFRDADRKLNFPIWGDSPWAVDCRDNWTPGLFYKVRAVYMDTNFGPQLEIREVVEADATDGFDPACLLPKSQFDPQQMFDDLLDLARSRIENEPQFGGIDSKRQS